MTSTYYHLHGTPLANGSIIEPGNFGRIVRAVGWEHPHAIRELALEDFRLAHFPDLPSRLSCVFLFPTEDDARGYRDNVAGFKRHCLYEVELLSADAPSFQSNAHAMPPNLPFSHEWPREYWSGAVEFRKRAPKAGYNEVLTTSPIVIKERLI